MNFRTQDRNRLLLIVLVILLSTGTAAAEKDRPTVALVLGGGAARGFSHIGLIRALEENGVPIDMIVGTSIGSIVAGLYSGGLSVDNMEQVALHMNASKLFDIPFPPTGGVIDSRGIQEFLDELLGGRTFDELAIPFRAVAVDLGTGEDVAFGEGLVSKAIQASMSIPGVFPAVEIDGKYYVDGGLKNQVPADVAAAMGADVIIAVSLEKDMQAADYRRLIDNLKLSLSALMGGYTEMHAAMADVVIVPKVGLDSSWEFQKVEYFIEQGYEAGLEYMEQIKAAILEQDPDFEFVPYRQAGYSKIELDEMVQRGEHRAESLPKRLTLRPELSFDDIYGFAKVGIKAAHGPLAWFNVGYRYGFNALNGGHEVFVGWGKENLGSIGIYLRKSREREALTFGVTVDGPEINKLLLEADYVSQGEKMWQVSASNRHLWTSPKVAAGLSLRLSGLRPDETDVPLGERILVGAAPQVEVYPWGEEQIPLGVILVRPYVIVRITVESPVTKLDLRPSLHLGIGSELNFFGLYPTEFSLGVELSGSKGTKFSIGFTGMEF
jgi:NTE family protein